MPPAPAFVAALRVIGLSENSSNTSLSESLVAPEEVEADAGAGAADADADAADAADEEGVMGWSGGDLA